MHRRTEIKKIKPILFNGDNYTKEWEKEAAKRGLPNAKTTPVALKALITDKACSLFEKDEVLSKVEMNSRYLIYVEKYIKDMEIEVKCLKNICLSQVIPAASAYQKNLTKTIIGIKEILGSKTDSAAQQDILKTSLELVNKIYKATREILAQVEAVSAIHDEAKKAERLCSKVKTRMDELREYVDALEEIVDDELWALPKFWEMLFIS